MNNNSDVGTLADEVADLLRHDNLDQRINTWITAVYLDIAGKAPLSLFLRKAGTYTIPAGTETVALSSITSASNPVALLVTNGNGAKLVAPRYVTFIDFSRMAHDMQGGAALQQAHDPIIWSIGPGVDETLGKGALYIAPATVQECYAELFYIGPTHHTTPLASNKYVALPYHFEHVLVWGAAAIGAKTLRPELYTLFRGEYEQALSEMNSIMSYKPDGVPVLRSVQGPYGGTPKMAGMQYPDTING